MMKRPHGIVWVVLDCLRADHVGCYGYPRNTTPNIDALARTCVKFEYAFSASSYTPPSHASMFTGKYPSNHSWRFDDIPVGLELDREIVLAEILSAQGYSTAMFVSLSAIFEQCLLGLGFSHIDKDFNNKPRRNGEETITRAIQWIRQNNSRPFFAFIHLFDIHAPYINREPYRSLFVGDKTYCTVPRLIERAEISWRASDGAIPDYMVLRPVFDDEGKLVDFERDLRYYVAQYDGAVRYTDDLVGKLIRFLEDLNLFQDTLLIITADHGDALGEDGLFDHGRTVYPEVIHVPLLIKPHTDWYVKVPRVVHEHVSLVDITPTIVELLEPDTNSFCFDGRSLVPLIECKQSTDYISRTLISEIELQIAQIKFEEIKVSPKDLDFSVERIRNTFDSNPVVRKEFFEAYRSIWQKEKRLFYRKPQSNHKNLIDWTGERYVPWVDLGTPEIHYEHLHRYYFASQFAEGKKVLDLASGEGYGCAILAEKAVDVTGVELDEEAVKHAASRYPLPNVRFIQGSITDVPIRGEKIFDVITCFEAIEHIEEHEKLLMEVKRLLKEKGLFIISSPNKLLYSDQTGYKNPYHVMELYFDEFRELLAKYFPYVCFLGQKVFPDSSIWPLGAREGFMTEFCVRKADTGFMQVGTQEKIPLYFIAIASEQQLPNGISYSTLTDVSEELFGRLRRMVDEREKLLAEMKREFSMEKEALRAQITDKEQSILRLEENLTNLTSRLSIKEKEFFQEKVRLETQLAEKNGLIVQHEESFNQLRKQLAEKDTELFLIRSSLGWRLLQKYRRVMDRLFPLHTSRRKFYEMAQKGLKTVLTEGPVVLGRKATQKAIRYFGSCRKTCVRDDRHERETSQESRVPAMYGPFYIGPFHADTVSARVSVIIPVRNAGPEFENILKKIRFQRGIKEIEIVIIDSGSTDGSLDIAHLWADTILTIDPKEFNHGATRNLGAKSARGDILVFTVQDAIPVGDYWLKSLVQPLLHLPDVAAVSCRQIPRVDADSFACWSINNHYESLRLFRDDIFRADEQYWKTKDHLEKRRRASLDNVCSAIKRVAFEREPFKPMKFAEDLELGLRLLQSGWVIGFLSSVGVIHSHNRSPFYFLKRSYLDTKVLRSLLEASFSTDTTVSHLGNLVFTLSHLNQQLKAWGTLLDNVEEVSCDYVKQKLNEALNRFETNYEKKNGGIRDELLTDNDVEKLLEELKGIAVGCSECYMEAIRRDVLTRSYQFLDYLFRTQVLPETDQVVWAIYKIFAVVMGDWLSRTTLPEKIISALEEGV